MEVRIQVTKSRFFTIIGVMLLVGAAIVVQGQSGTVPNPGHSADSISGGTIDGMVSIRGTRSDNIETLLKVFNLNQAGNEKALEVQSISGESSPQLFLTTSSQGGDPASLLIGANGVGAINIQNSATANMLYLTGSNAGIGTTSPQYKLDVSGVVRATGIRFANDAEVQTKATGPGACSIVYSSNQYAICPAGTKVMGGGVDCSDSQAKLSCPVVGQSQPCVNVADPAPIDAQGWHGQCSGSAIDGTYAICCPA